MNSEILKPKRKRRDKAVSAPMDKLLNWVLMYDDYFNEDNIDKIFEIDNPDVYKLFSIINIVSIIAAEFRRENYIPDSSDKKCLIDLYSKYYKEINSHRAAKGKRRISTNAIQQAAIKLQEEAHVINNIDAAQDNLYCMREKQMDENQLIKADNPKMQKAISIKAKKGTLRSTSRAMLVKLIERENTTSLDLSFRDFSEQDLSGMDLSGSNFTKSKFHHSNLSGANLSNAVLASVTIETSNLSGALLKWASITDSSICNSVLDYADLSQSSITRTDLSSSSMKNSFLQKSLLYQVNINSVNLAGAKLSGATLEFIQHNEFTAFYAPLCPTKGSFYGYTKCKDKVIELVILKDSNRSNATSRICRCDKAKVTNIEGNLRKIVSGNTPWLVFTKNNIIQLPDFDEDRWNEKGRGILFFLTEEEARIG